MGRHANADIKRAFSEYQDNDTPTKCNKVRCLHCGYTRAKNTTRQIEHLQECQAYLQSDEAQDSLRQQGLSGSPLDPTMTQTTNGNPNPGIFTGHAPNPNLQVHRRGPNQNKRPRESNSSLNMTPSHIPPPAPQGASLTSHLLTKNSVAFIRATEQPFLSHAGCGTLSANVLTQWMIQDTHYQRAYIRFIGNLLGKIRLPSAPNSQFHPLYRTMDMLISALNNLRREMSFFENTATKYGIHLSDEKPMPITRAYVDLFTSVSDASSSLLEGMVVLWATEHCYRTAWHYASTFALSGPAPSTESHIACLHQALIPNWTSLAFSKFVDTLAQTVDELANSNTVKDGREEMLRCEEAFRQVCWVEERFWPDVDGMGEEDESAGRGRDTAAFAGGETVEGEFGKTGMMQITGGGGGDMNGGGPVNGTTPVMGGAENGGS